MLRTNFAILLGLIAIAPVAHAKPGVGETYGTRDPRICASRTAPEKGPITPEAAARYIACRLERVGIDGNTLYLVKDVQVQVGKPRAFDRALDYLRTDIDPEQPLYPTRGSFTQYQCNRAKASYVKPGHNCNLHAYAKARGTCYKTGFGDWTCDFTGESNSDTVSKAVPPPPRM
jgi:hypothetical protein